MISTSEQDGATKRDLFAEQQPHHRANACFNNDTEDERFQEVHKNGRITFVPVQELAVKNNLQGGEG